MKRPPSKYEKIFAKNLRRLRADESQVRFAKQLGIAQSTLNRLENLDASPTLYLLEKIAGRLKISISELLE